MRLILLFLLMSLQSHSQDTTKVMMMYSDTSLTDLVGIDENGEEYEELGFDTYCYWRRGYMVGDLFLDENKKRIPESNVVWIYKKIK